MGNKVIYCMALVFSILFEARAAPSGMQYNFANTNDNSGVTVVRHEIVANYTNYSIGTVTTQYSTPLDDITHNGIRLGFRNTYNGLSGTGHISMMNGDKRYIAGDAAFSYSLSRSVTLGANLWSDIVDSTLGIANNVKLGGESIGVDVDNGVWGVSAGLKNVRYSDGNVQNGRYARAWVSSTTGLQAYVTVKDHTNSTSSAYYASPPHYNRSGVGIGYRTMYENYRIAIQAEHSVITTTYTRDIASTWRFRITGPVTTSWKMSVEYGRDQSNSLDFSYRYVNMSLLYLF